MTQQHLIPTQVSYFKCLNCCHSPTRSMMIDFPFGEASWLLLQIKLAQGYFIHSVKVYDD